MRLKPRASITVSILLSLAPMARSQTTGTSCSFTDNFNRPNGLVGNGWSNTIGNSGGNLTIQNDAVSTPGPNGRAGIYRPTSFGGSVTVSATLTQKNGNGGLLNAYDADILFGSDGNLGTGYGIKFYRADQTYADSAVKLELNGAMLGAANSSFQFGASITVTVTLAPDGSVTGSVSGDGNTFNFTASSRTLTFAGSNVAIDSGFPDGQSNTITNATVDNVSIASSCSTVPLITGVVNAASNSPTIAPNTWVAITGLNLAQTTRTWQASDFIGNTMPTTLDGVSVTMNNEKAYLYYVSPSQVNVLTPPDLTLGQVQVQVTNNGVSSGQVTAQVQQYSPSFFLFDGSHVAATHAQGNLLAPASLYPGLSTPAMQNEEVVLYGNGFGPTSPTVVNGSSGQSGMLPTLPVIKVGGIPATVAFAGLVAPGEYQFNVVVPGSAQGGDNSLTATYAGLTTPPNVFLALALPPATLSTLTLSSSAVTGGQSLTGQVTLSSPAPSAIDVLLSSSGSAVQIPNSVHIAAGQTSAAFSVTTTVVTSTQTETITASFGGVQRTATVTLSPPAPTNPFVNYQISIATMLTLSGKQTAATITVTVPVFGYALVDSTADVNSGILLYAYFLGPSFSGSTVSFSSVEGDYSNISSSGLGSGSGVMTAGTLSITAASPSVGTSVTGTLKFSTASGAFTADFSGKITASSQLQ